MRVVKNADTRSVGSLQPLTMGLLIPWVVLCSFLRKYIVRCVVTFSGGQR